MEFKGTKGKWIVSIYDEAFIFSELNGLEGNVICLPPNNNYPKSRLNWKFNSKLISKAPEMLEMLLKIRNKQPINTKQLDELIKEATTI